MSKWSLEVPLSLVAAGCIICILSAIGSLSMVIDSETAWTMFIVGSILALIGTVISLAVIYIKKSGD